MSRGGAFVETAERLPLGAAVSVELFHREAEGPLRFTGVVRWTGDRGFGLQFGRLGTREKHGLCRLLSELREHTGGGSRASGF